MKYVAATLTAVALLYLGDLDGGRKALQEKTAPVSGQPRQPPPSPTPRGFNLLVSPSSTSVDQGAVSNPVTITANPVGGFSGSVIVEIDGIPQGTTVSPSLPFLVYAGSSQQVTFWCSVSAATGNFTILVRGTSGVLSRSASLPLTVRERPTAPSRRPMDVLGYSLFASVGLFAVYYTWRKWANQIPVLAGTVTVNGEALESFRVAVSSSGDIIKRSASNGEFSLLDIPTGNLSLVVSLPDETAMRLEADCAMSGRFAHLDVKLSLQISALQVSDGGDNKRSLSWNLPSMPEIKPSQGIKVTKYTAKYEHRVLWKHSNSDAVAEIGTASSDSQSGKVTFSVPSGDHCIYVVETNLVGCSSIKARQEVPA